MDIQSAQRQIIEAFANADDLLEKHTLLIHMASLLPSTSDSLRTERYRIRKCQSSLWFHGYFIKGSFHMEVDSDTLIVKGLLALLLQIYENRTAKEILETDLFFFSKMGLDGYMSESRTNGLIEISKRIHALAQSELNRI